MGHLDKRLDPDKDSTGHQSGGVKDGVSGNVPESADHERNKHANDHATASPDVVRKAADRAPSGRTG